MPVPKATMYEHYCLPAGKHEIWCAWKFPVMEPIPEALSMKKFPDD